MELKRFPRSEIGYFWSFPVISGHFGVFSSVQAGGSHRQLSRLPVDPPGLFLWLLAEMVPNGGFGPFWTIFGVFLVFLSISSPRARLARGSNCLSHVGSYGCIDLGPLS